MDMSYGKRVMGLKKIWPATPSALAAATLSAAQTAQDRICESCLQGEAETERLSWNVEKGGLFHGRP
jgi:hypothetical protein